MTAADRASGTFTGATATVDVSGWRLPFTGARVTATVTASTGLGSAADDESTDVSWGQPPSVVQNLTITPDDATAPTRVSAVWSLPANDGGIGVDSYRVCWVVNGGAAQALRHDLRNHGGDRPRRPRAPRRPSPATPSRSP